MASKSPTPTTEVAARATAEPEKVKVYWIGPEDTYVNGYPQADAEVPPDEAEFLVATGLFSMEPSPEGKHAKEDAGAPEPGPTPEADPAEAVVAEPAPADGPSGAVV